MTWTKLDTFSASCSNISRLFRAKMSILRDLCVSLPRHRCRSRGEAKAADDGLEPGMSWEVWRHKKKLKVRALGRNSMGAQMDLRA